MKKEHKFLAFIFISLFALSIISTALVSAATVGETFTSFVKDVFSGATSSLSDASKGTISQILLTVLVILLVYSIFSSLPIFPRDNAWIQWGVSIIVGILSFIFVSAEDIKYILTTYEALGIMLTTIIPLVILLTFTFKLRQDNVSYAGLINKILLIGFGLYIFLKWFTLEAGATLAWLYPLTLVGVIIWLILERWIFFKIFKSAMAGDSEQVNKYALANLNAQWEKKVAQFENVPYESTTWNTLRDELINLQKKLKRYGVDVNVPWQR